MFSRDQMYEVLRHTEEAFGSYAADRMSGYADESTIQNLHKNMLDMMVRSLIDDNAIKGAERVAKEQEIEMQAIERRLALGKISKQPRGGISAMDMLRA
jgi:poly-D-alanine transfer protein DltD